MILHYGGKYRGSQDDLSYLEHEEGAVMFKEAKDANQLSAIMTVLSAGMVIVCIVILWIRAGDVFFDKISILFYLLTIIPHELLHAVCYKYDVYLYHDPMRGHAVLAGPERMSKGKFIFKSLLPPVIPGWIPFLLFMIRPEFRMAGTLGVPEIAAGDYYNAYNALTQMPKGAWACMHKYNTFWFMPKEKTRKADRAKKTNHRNRSAAPENRLFPFSGNLRIHIVFLESGSGLFWFRA